MNGSTPIATQGPKTAAFRAVNRIGGVKKGRGAHWLILLGLAGPALGISIFYGAVAVENSLSGEKLGRCPMRDIIERPHALGIAAFLGWEGLLCAGALILRKKRKEDAYRQFRLARQIVQNISDGVVVADCKGRLVLSNEAARKISGRGDKESPSSQWSQEYGLFLPGTNTPYPPDQLPLARAIRGEEVHEVDIFVRNQIVKEGAWVSVSGRPLLDDHGFVQGGVVVFQDVTRRKSAEELSGRLTNAVEQTADVVFITDRAGTIEYVNPAFETVTGFPAAEALGRNPRILKSGVQDQQYYNDLWSTITEGKAFRGTTVNRRKCGRLFHAEQTITPMRDEGGRITHFVSVLKDMTERRKIQEQETEMRIAAGVQRRLFPRSPPRLPGYDVSGAAFSADATGGDYFDFLTISDEKLGIVVADVQGHGVGPALVMAQTRAYLRAFTRANPDPGDILTKINKVLHADFEEGFFVTMMLVMIDIPTGKFVYANAGHPYGYLFNQSGVVQNILQSTGLPLGLFPDREFKSRDDFELAPGDFLVLLTDGLIESEGPDETEFGIERILEFVNSHCEESAEDIVNSLYSAARDFEGDQLQRDDITLVACKRQPQA